MKRRLAAMLAMGLVAISVLAGCFRTRVAETETAEDETQSQDTAPKTHPPIPMPAQLNPKAPTPPPATAESSVQPGTPQAKAMGLNLATGLSDVFHDAANRVLPAVVTIRTVSASHRIAFGEDDDSGVQESLGSGVLIDASGIVLTNYHVVRDTVESKGQSVVQLHDGREFRISRVLGDQQTDLAVVQLENASNLPFAQLGDSDALKVGDWVLAVGEPFGLEATVTAGIISAKGRGLGISPREEFLQTDAPINPGNSGGPLVNLRGDVVGINTAISSTTGGYQGIGFTIPINLAKWAARQLIENGTIRWAYLGVGVRKLTPQLAERLDLHDTQGLLVVEVRRNSPAAEAGIRPGDVITRFDDKPVTDPQQLQSLVGTSPIGSQHSLDLLRGGKSVSLQASIREQPSNQGVARRPPGSGLSPR